MDEEKKYLLAVIQLYLTSEPEGINAYLFKLRELKLMIHTYIITVTPTIRDNHVNHVSK